MVINPELLGAMRTKSPAERLTRVTPTEVASGIDVVVAASAKDPGTEINDGFFSISQRSTWIKKLAGLCL